MTSLLARIVVGMLLAMVGAGPGVSASEAAPEDLFEHLAGCFRVSYRYVEDGVHDKRIEGDIFEDIILEREANGVYALQHHGIFRGNRIKHWREEWRREADGAFTQTVIGPFEDFRYACTAPFEFNQWRCRVEGAPKPQRDRDRTDYVTLDRENTLQITPRGWVHAQNNVKRDAVRQAVGNEVGWNEYRRVDASECAAASE